MTPLAIGSVHTEVVALEWTAACLLWGLQIRGARNHSAKKYPGISIPSLACWLLAFVCLLQLVPLPALLHEWLNPTGYALFEEGWRAMFGTSAPEGTWRPLSLDPGATADRGLRWLTLGIVATVSLNHAREKRGCDEILWAITTGGGLVVLAGLLPHLVGSDAMLLIYQPRAELAEARYTTFVNPNHASIFAGLASLAALTLALRSRGQALRRSAATLIGLVLMVIVFESRSITGIAFYMIAVGGLMILMLREARTIRAQWLERLLSSRRHRRFLQAVGGVCILVPVVATVMLAWGDESVRSVLLSIEGGATLLEKMTGRLEILGSSLQIIPDYPLLGSGAGSTDRILPPYVDWSQMASATAPTIENEPLEWLFQFGIPVGLVASGLFGAYGWFVYRRYRRRPRSRYAFALTAILFSALNASMHFPFFMLGYSLPAIAAVEVSGFPAQSSEAFASESSPRWHWDWQRGVLRLHERVYQWLPLVALGTGLLLGATYRAQHVDVSEIPNAPDEVANGELEKLVRTIPSDGNLYARAARIDRKEEQFDEATRRAEYAFEVEPKHKMALIKAVNYRAAGELDQVVDTYRALFSDAYANVPEGWINQYLLVHLDDPRRIARALEHASPNYWTRATDALKEQAPPARRAQLGLELVERRPDTFEGYHILIDAYHDMEQHVLAEMWARRLLSRNIPNRKGKRPAGYALLLKVLRHQDRPQDAWQLAVEAIGQTPRSLGIARALIDLRPSPSSEVSERERHAVEQASNTICRYTDRDWARRRCWLGRGWLAETEGRPDDARMHYERVAEKVQEPRPLLQFYARHGMCVELEQFRADWQKQHSADKYAELFERFRDQCDQEPSE